MPRSAPAPPVPSGCSPAASPRSHAHCPTLPAARSAILQLSPQGLRAGVLWPVAPRPSEESRQPVPSSMQQSRPEGSRPANLAPAPLPPTIRSPWILPSGTPASVVCLLCPYVCDAETCDAGTACCRTAWPRCVFQPRIKGPLRWQLLRRLIQVELAQRLALRRVVLRALHRFGKPPVQHIFLVALRLHRLPEEALLALLLFTQSARGSFEVFKGALPWSGLVADDGTRLRIDRQDRATVRTRYLECALLLRHGTPF